MTLLHLAKVSYKQIFMHTNDFQLKKVFFETTKLSYVAIVILSSVILFDIYCMTLLKLTVI